MSGFWVILNLKHENWAQSATKIGVIIIEWANICDFCHMKRGERWKEIQTYPNSGLGEIGPHCNLLTYTHIWVSISGKKCLQFLQLLAGKMRSLATLPLHILAIFSVFRLVQLTVGVIWTLTRKLMARICKNQKRFSKILVFFVYFVHFIASRGPIFHSINFSLFLVLFGTCSFYFLYSDFDAISHILRIISAQFQSWIFKNIFLFHLTWFDFYSGGGQMRCAIGWITGVYPRGHNPRGGHITVINRGKAGL